jgi:ectoine hydroxylase-related dioxygenase (phytanoyl-CoA dioxygenase family)
MSTLAAMTSEERETFLRDGYLLLPGVLTPEEVAAFRQRAEAVVAEAMARDAVFREATYHSNSFKVARLLERTDAFDELMDHPRVLGKLVSLIGHYIQVMGSEVFVRGAADEAITGFHTDLGEALQQILPTPDNPMLTVKIQYFLTDLSSADAGNFMVIPGTHFRRAATSNRECMIDEVNETVPPGSVPAGARQILARPGDVVAFPWTLWHAVAPNRSGRTRLSVTFRYGQLALRPLENYGGILRDPARVFTPRQRRLLGDLAISPATGNYNYWKPQDQRQVMLGETVEVV